MFWKKRRASERVYADAAAATPLSARALQELVRLLPLFGNPGALHQEALDARAELEEAREIVARTIGAHADEIVFTASGTEANNLAIQGLLRPLLLEHGELHAVSSAVEHQSVLAPLRALEREGLYLTVLPVDSEGLVDPQALKEALNEQTVFVSLQLLNSEIGAIEPVRECAKVIRHERLRRTPSATALRAARPSPTVAEGDSASLPLYFHTDACQAPLWLPLAVEKLGIDLMTLDGQKVLGPKGAGALYIKRGVALEPILWGGSQERGLRGGTQNPAVAKSFAVALQDAQHGVEERSKNIGEVRDYLLQELERLIPSAVLNGPQPGPHRAPNNLNISLPGLPSELAVVALDSEGVAASTRSACNTLDEASSHVIAALGVAPELARTALRLTLLPSATKREARRIAQALAAIVQRQQNMV